MTAPRTPEQLAETALTPGFGATFPDADAAAAVREMLVRLQAAERERDGLRVKANGWVQHDTEAYAAQSMRALKRAEAAEARVKELEATLGEALARIRTRRLGIHMDGSPQYGQPLYRELDAMLAAAASEEPTP